MLPIISLLAPAAGNIPLVTFDGAPETTFKFTELNDPVMGGKSTGEWSVDTNGGFGSMTGKVVDVPSLKAPGFIKAAADGSFSDASPALDGDLVLTLRSSTTSYKGFRVTFAAGTLSPSYACAGGGQIPFSRGCYKARFDVPASAASDFVDVRIPFANFSDLWSPATGDQVKTFQQDSSACPSTKALKSIKRFEIWAEGVSGDVQIDLRAISAAPAAGHLQVPVLMARPPTEFQSCNAAVQDKLKFGISGRTTPTIPVAVDPKETLAEAVCCDLRTRDYAEPQFLFTAPDIALFDKITKNGVTTFYDSVCGLPMFKAPVGRSFADFQADTQEHGWPSFRTGEVFTDNLVTNTTNGFVTSKCGTHLGTYLPDDKGPRWCIDLSCISGNEA